MSLTDTSTGTSTVSMKPTQQSDYPKVFCVHCGTWKPRAVCAKGDGFALCEPCLLILLRRVGGEGTK